MQERKNARKKEYKKKRKKERKKEMDGRTDGQTDGQMTDRLTKPFYSSRFLEILRSNFREQISRLGIWELNLILPVPVPENGNGKIKKLTLNHLVNELIKIYYKLKRLGNNMTMYVIPLCCFVLS
jgi:hypothetical protein